MMRFAPGSRLLALRSAPLALALALGAGLATNAASRHASYTLDQAERGQLEYIENCGECHGGDLSGHFGPALAGPLGRTQYESGAATYAYLTAHMPVGNSGALTVAVYLDIMAFLYERNGIPAGRAPLTKDAVSRDSVALGK
jgi:mono/diheme cytochrome c family protein